MKVGRCQCDDCLYGLEGKARIADLENQLAEAKALLESEFATSRQTACGLEKQLANAEHCLAEQSKVIHEANATIGAMRDLLTDGQPDGMHGTRCGCLWHVAAKAALFSSAGQDWEAKIRADERRKTLGEEFKEAIEEIEIRTFLANKREVSP